MAHYLLEDLFFALPLSVPDNLAGRDVRNAAAVETLVAMQPNKAPDSMLEIILARAQALELLRRANQPGQSIDMTLHHCSQATSFAASMRIAEAENR